MSNRSEKFIKHTMGLEGGYTDHKSDIGGKTNFGITEAVARRNGFTGDMKDLTYDIAYEIYYKDYYKPMKIDDIDNETLAFKVYDFGVNAGNGRSIITLQEAVNMCSNGQPLKIDGGIGPITLKAVNYTREIDKLCLVFEANKIARYIEITKAREANEDFIKGWLDKRTDLELKNYK